MEQRIVASAERWRAREGKSSVFQRPLLTAEEVNLEVIYDRYAGLDVHKMSAYEARSGKKMESETAVFATFTSDLERLLDYLRTRNIRRVVME